MITLSQDLFDELNAHQHTGNRQAPKYGVKGVSNHELDAIERDLGFDLPPDLRFLLTHVQDPGGVFFPWAEFTLASYKASIERVYSGIHFDIEHNKIWLSRWGQRPSSLAEAKAIADADMKTWPRLVPVSGHRYLPVDPCLDRNPVFSIWQTDIIYYGADLADYLVREFVSGPGERPFPNLKRRIPVWSDFVESTDGFFA